MWSLTRLLSELITALRANSEATRKNTSAALYVASKIDQLLDRLRNLPDPEPISLLVTAETDSMLTFKIVLPALPEGPNDIASGELTVTVAGGAPVLFPTTKDQTEVTGLTGNDNDLVEASFVFVDDAGNRSTTPSTLAVTLTDTIPPASPDALALVVTGES